MSELTRDLPRFELGFFPTPMHELLRLSDSLGGPRILVKRDDLNGLAFGGNKIRKLEFLVGHALAEGCDTLITGGAQQSNHCRQTAAAAARAGLECHLALGGRAPETAEGNFLLDQILGAQAHWCGEHRKGEDIGEIAQALRDEGRRPYVIPYGGSDAVGTSGFVQAAQELYEQLRTAGIRASHVVCASSSGATHAGLALAVSRWPSPCRVVGVQIDEDEPGAPSLSERVAELAHGAADRLGWTTDLTASDVALWSDYTGGGYGVVGDLERDAVFRCGREEGLLLDPVYTGRAMGGLLDRIERGELTDEHTVVFWHTGGQPALFPYASELGSPA